MELSVNMQQKIRVFLSFSIPTLMLVIGNVLNQSLGRLKGLIKSLKWLYRCAKLKV
jgi:hypothetical protein